MNKAAFLDSNKALRERIKGAIESHFKDQGLGFDMSAFQGEAKQDLEKITTDAFFYGAGVFPELTDSQT